jgi:four helix bundle protein
VGTIQSYKDLIAYQKSYEVVRLIYKKSSAFPKEELYGLASQLKRSAVSIPSNIAEGLCAGQRNMCNFCELP